MTTLFVSPHLDDVALSCAARLIDASERGEAVLIVSVFTEGASKSRSRYRARRAEDLAAFDSLGFDVRHLGLRDAPFRLGCGFDVDALTQLPSAQDVALVRDAIAPVLEDVRPDCVWLPAGVGGHVDHRAVHALRALLGRRARFYVERPYAFDRATLTRWQDKNSPFGRLSLGKATWSPARLDAVIALVDHYHSQLRWLFGEATCRSVFERCAVEHGQFFELIATDVSSDSTKASQ